MKHPRLLRHEVAYSHMKDGNFNLAILELKDSIAENGPNVLSLIDLAASYSCATDYDNFIKYTEVAWNEYQKCFARLSLKSKFHATLGLGRILEDSGRLSEALKVYNEYLNLDFSETETVLKRQIQCELLRVYAMIGDREKTATLYLALVQHSNTNEKMKTDLEHALILSEYQYIGFETAIQRFLKAKDVLPSQGKRLVFFDFIFEVLLNSSSELVDLNLFSEFLYLECDPFERGVWDIFLSCRNLEPNAPLSLIRSDDMSPLCSVRYLILLDLFQLMPQHEVELRNKINLLLLALDAHTRKLVSNIWKINRKSVQVIVLETGIQGSRGETVNLQKQQKIVQFLNFVMDNPEASASDFSKHLFELDYSDSIEARLRTLIVRINKLFEVHFGIQKAFTLSKAMIVLSPNLQLVKGQRH